MVVSNRTIARLRSVAAVSVSLAALIVTSILFVSTLMGQEVSNRNLLEAAVLGALVGAVLASYELLFVEGRYGRAIRRAHFLVSLTLSIAVYLVTITAVVVLYETWAYPEAGRDTYFGYQIDYDTALMLDIVTTFLMISLLLFFVTIRRVFGARQLGNVILGRYRTGIYEERVFMFLDIEASTQMAEELGDLGAYDLISTFYFDIDEAILDHNGEAHRYIGDEIVITWPLAVGLRNANCLRCFFATEDIITRRAEVYQKRFGRVPGFRAGLHCGRVVAGFTGDSKRQISYFGDTVNTAARLEKTCRELGYNLVASADVIRNTNVPDELEAVELGGYELRGKAEKVELFGIQRREQ